MIGGPPMMPYPQMQPAYPMLMQPAPHQQWPAMPRQNAVAPPTAQAAPPRPIAQPAQQPRQQPQPIAYLPPPKPTIRAQGPDEGQPSALSLPSPEDLGVSTRKASVDWTKVHCRLDELGATCFHLEKHAKGGCRLTCLLATGKPDQNHHIDVEAADESECVRLALEKADTFAKRR